MNEGFTLVNMCEDYEEDKIEHIITWAHRIGIKRTIKIAVLFSLLGLLCVFSLLLKLNDYILNLRSFVFFALVLFTSGLIVKATYEVYEILTYDDLIQATKIYGTRLQRWFLITRYPLIFSALVLLIV